MMMHQFLLSDVNKLTAHEMTALNVALTIRFSILLDTKYMTAEQIPAETVPTTRKNFRPSRSIPRTFED
jgi:hypothetical protein